MPSLYLSTPGAKASLVSEHLRVEIPDANDKSRSAVRTIPLHEIERAFIEEHTDISVSALCELLRREIPVCFSSAHSGRVLGHALAPDGRAANRIAHYQRALDPGFALAVAATLVDAKIANSRRILQRLSANRPDADCTHVNATLEHDRRATLSATNLDSLRGHEGTAAGRYFEALSGFFPVHCPFERRSRRPPHNPANAILSYGYTLLVGEMETVLHAIGLDPALGFLHEPEDKRPALALDLIEPFRAPIVDALALDLLNHAILRPDTHFEHRNGGIYLTRDGRQRLHLGYERRLEREFTSEQTGKRTKLRLEFLNQVRSLRDSILSLSPFEPFLMN
ncbi:MAG: CRISPR-associated endonuclease Cas1 [Puniceicoccales bacterium]|nr:CRISPR-associated endonuclease Cas1 [Puniceicoccales bacterium]